MICVITIIENMAVQGEKSKKEQAQDAIDNLLQDLNHKMNWTGDMLVYVPELIQNETDYWLRHFKGCLSKSIPILSEFDGGMEFSIFLKSATLSMLDGHSQLFTAPWTREPNRQLWLNAYANELVKLADRSYIIQIYQGMPNVTGGDLESINALRKIIETIFSFDFIPDDFETMGVDIMHMRNAQLIFMYAYVYTNEEKRKNLAEELVLVIEQENGKHRPVDMAWLTVVFAPFYYHRKMNNMYCDNIFYNEWLPLYDFWHEMFDRM